MSGLGSGLLAGGLCAGSREGSEFVGGLVEGVESWRV